MYLYRRFKSYFGMKPYLRHIKKLKYRRAMTAFRLSAHNLEIETGRYVYDRTLSGKKCFIKREDRFCTFCYDEFKYKVMGGEMHAILNCPRFHDVRKRLFVRIELLVPNIKELNDNDKLCYILTSEDECARLFSRFLRVVLSAQRSSFLKLWRQLNNPDG